MKNTVKKILALVFVVAMVCSLAVPAFANDGDDKVDVKINVVLPSGDVVRATAELDVKKANVENALKVSAVDAVLDINATTGKVSAIKLDNLPTTTVTTKVTDKAITGEFGTGSVVVAVNGKAVAEDLGTVAVEEDDVITVYWADSTLGTKLAMVDDSNIAAGIVSLYYYDAEGNRQPLTGAKISLTTNIGGTGVVRDYTNIVAPEKTNKTLTAEYHFTTDENGQIWIAPEYLDNKAGATYYIQYAMANNVAGANNAIPVEKYEDSIVEDLKSVTKENGYTDAEVSYYNGKLNKNVVDVEVIKYPIVVEANLYDVAGATGDMTVVYALVAFAAVATLAAVVVMKKKAVKAN